MNDRAAAGPTVDALATALWEARQASRPVSAALEWDALSAGRAAEIGQALYRRVTSEAPVAWKMGAFDEEARRRLGLPGALVQAVLPDRLHTDVTRLELRIDDFVQPKLEAEIGVRVDASGATWFVPCVEVADCRFEGWETPPLAALADFGLQGAMVFGFPVAAPETIHVRVGRDGEDIASASASWDQALERLSHLPETRRSDVYVATGSITPMFPVEPGDWEFEFADLGSLTLSLC